MSGYFLFFMDESQNEKVDERWLILQFKTIEHHLSEVFKRLRQHEIEPILIKGWAASRNYPEPWRRMFADVDVAVDPADYEKALQLLPFSGVQVDFHSGLRYLDSVEWASLYGNSETVAVSGVPIRLLSSEDHLRVLCVHWLNDGGANRQRLEDIYYAVQNRPASFDWERCLGVVAENRRRWIVCVIGLAHRYLDLPVDDLPFADEARRIPAWLIRELEKEWSSGIRLLPLDMCLHDRKLLYQQIRKRLPPNPIEAMVEMDGDLEAANKLLYYQLGSIAMRIRPSARRLWRAIFSKKPQDNDEN